MDKGSAVRAGTILQQRERQDTQELYRSHAPERPGRTGRYAPRVPRLTESQRSCAAILQRRPRCAEPPEHKYAATSASGQGQTGSAGTRKAPLDFNCVTSPVRVCVSSRRIAALTVTTPQKVRIRTATLGGFFYPVSWDTFSVTH